MKYPEDILTENPGSIAFARYAAELVAQGDLDRAGEILNEGIAANPQYATGYSVLAAWHAARGEHESEVEALERALSLDPQSPADNLRLGRIYTDMGRNGEAMDRFRAAERFEPGALEVQSGLALAGRTVSGGEETASHGDGSGEADTDRMEAGSVDSDEVAAETFEPEEPSPEEGDISEGQAPESTVAEADEPAGESPDGGRQAPQGTEPSMPFDLSWLVEEGETAAQDVVRGQPEKGEQLHELPTEDLFTLENIAEDIPDYAAMFNETRSTDESKPEKDILDLRETENEEYRKLAEDDVLTAEERALLEKYEESGSAGLGGEDIELEALGFGPSVMEDGPPEVQHPDREAESPAGTDLGIDYTDILAEFHTGEPSTVPVEDAETIGEVEEEALDSEPAAVEAPAEEEPAAEEEREDRPVDRTEYVDVEYTKFAESIAEPLEVTERPAEPDKGDEDEDIRAIELLIRSAPEEPFIPGGTDEFDYPDDLQPVEEEERNADNEPSLDELIARYERMLDASGTLKTDAQPRTPQKPRARRISDDAYSDYTVTMAEIYVAQGLFARAIDIYTVLIDRNPDNEDMKARVQTLRSMLDRQVEGS